MVEGSGAGLDGATGLLREVTPGTGGAGLVVERLEPFKGGGGELRRVPDGFGAVLVAGFGALEMPGFVADFLGSGALVVVGVLGFDEMTELSAASFSSSRIRRDRLTGSFSFIASSKASSRCRFRSMNFLFSALSFGRYVRFEPPPLAVEPEPSLSISSM